MDLSLLNPSDDDRLIKSKNNYFRIKIKILGSMKTTRLKNPLSHCKKSAIKETNLVTSQYFNASINKYTKLKSIFYSSTSSTIKDPSKASFPTNTLPEENTEQDKQMEARRKNKMEHQDNLLTAKARYICHDHMYCNTFSPFSFLYLPAFLCIRYMLSVFY